MRITGYLEIGFGCYVPSDKAVDGVAVRTNMGRLLLSALPYVRQFERSDGRRSLTCAVRQAAAKRDDTLVHVEGLVTNLDEFFDEAVGGNAVPRVCDLSREALAHFAPADVLDSVEAEFAKMEKDLGLVPTEEPRWYALMTEYFN